MSIKTRDQLFRGMNEWRLREQLLMAHDVWEEFLSINFQAGEMKLSEQEKERWQAELLNRLTNILQAHSTCILCGAKELPQEDQHVCTE